MRASVMGSMLAALALAAVAGGGCANPGPGSGGGLASGAAVHRVKRQNMDLGEFREVDFATLAAEGTSMRNAPVRVRSLLVAPAGGRAALRDPAGPGGRGAAAIPVDLGALEPEERERLAARCGASPCEADVLGVVQVPLLSDTFYLVAYHLEGLAGPPG